MMNPSNERIRLFYLSLFLLIFCLFGCSPHEKRKLDFVIEGSKISYHGSLLILEDNLANWIKILGKPSRHFSLANEIYVWDNLGVLCYCEYKNNKVGALTIAFRPRTLDFWPIKYFEGCISVDGAIIDRNTPITDFNRNKKGQPFKEAYFPTIYDYCVDNIYDVYVRLDLDDMGNILQFGISKVKDENK